LRDVADHSGMPRDRGPAVLEVDDLTIALPAGGDRPHAVEHASLVLRPRETLCVVGESGSGKSMLALALMGLLPKGVTVAGGAVRLEGTDILTLPAEAMRDLRGRRIAMIFQEPMTALNPIMTVGRQIAEVLDSHNVGSGAERRRRVLSLLESVGLPDPDQLIDSYPFRLSGGQRQRVMIAAALALEPAVLIGDEPTTALDVTTQMQILRLIKRLQAERDTGMLLITHDFGVVAEVADRVAVMQHGRIVETGPVDQILARPAHPYTKSLIAAVPKLAPRAARPLGEAIVLEAAGLTKTYRRGGRLFARGSLVKALDRPDFRLRRGETLGVVGESGSGKSTLARCLLRLLEPEAGEIRFAGTDLMALGSRALKPFRKRVQMVFQDPFASLNPRRRIGDIIAAGPRLHGTSKHEARARTRELLALVGLDPSVTDRFPHEFSGGQRQRIAIARALALEPELLIADEPVSALDVSVQAQVLALLDALRQRLGLSMVFITHDLRIAGQICDTIAVMRHGRIVEYGPPDQVLLMPRNAYTQELVASIPGVAR
jgi:peptide/nickel transport system ATP-binding protein